MEKNAHLHMTRPCCHTWNNNHPIADTTLMRAVHDAHPVRPGHALIYPIRHVNHFTQLTTTEYAHMRDLLDAITTAADVEDATIAINDGTNAGRTIPHLHIHVIPHTPTNPLPRGGIRRLFIPNPHEDTWK